MSLNNPTIRTNDSSEESSSSPSVASGVSRVRSTVYIVAAGISLIVGALGFVLPVLPGTPFVLLGSLLLLKGSPRLHARLRESRFFGRILRDWEELGGIRPHDKIRAIVVVVLGAVFTFIFGPQSNLLRWVAAFFISIGLWIIIRLPPARG